MRLFRVQFPHTIDLIRNALTAVLLILVATASQASLPWSPVFSEDFNYAANSRLNDSTAWDGTATTQMVIDSAGSAVRIIGGSGAWTAGHTMSPAYAGASNVIWFHVIANSGVGTDTMWSIWLDDVNGNNLARYYGSGTSCRGRIGGSNTSLTGGLTLTAGPHDLDIRIDTAANTSTFYVDGGLLGTLDHTSTPGNTLGKVRFENLDNSSAIGQSITFDEMRIGQDIPPTAPPGVPNVTAPANGAVVTTRTPTIQWTGDAHDAYEVHINTTNNSADANGWDSGQVANPGSSCVTGTLADATQYYVFVRLRNVIGWGPWTAVGRYFDVSVPLVIIPLPQELTMKSGSFQVNANTQIVMNTSPDAKDTFTADQLKRKIWDTTGYTLNIVQGSAGAPTSNVIAIGDPAKNTAVASIIATWTEAAGKASKSEGYMLGVKNTSIVVCGYDQPGTFYGCQTLIQLFEQRGSQSIASLFCYDYPELQWRGTMVRVWNAPDHAFVMELISEVMARYKLNVLQMEFQYAAIFPSHPELYWNLPLDQRQPGPFNLETVVPIADWAKKHFIEVVPCSGAWTHSDGLITNWTLNPNLREYRTGMDPWGSNENLCPRDPAAQQMVHDLWTDLINLFHPNYIHTGWDEASWMGHSSCSYCKNVSQRTLFNEFLWNDRNWLMARGVRPTMWGDMLRSDENGLTGNKYLVAGTMPRETVVLDWEYTHDVRHDNEASAARWESLGLTWCASPYGGYQPWEVNIDVWGDLAKQYSGKGLFAFNKFRCGTKQGTLDYGFQHMEVGNFVCYGEWGWNPDGRASSPPPYDEMLIVRQQVPPDPTIGFTASPAGANVNLTWTNPPDSTMQGTWIVYRTDRYPSDPTDGILVEDVAGSPNASRSCVHAAPLGATLYYAAFAHDAVRHFSSASTATVNNGSPLALSSLSAMQDGRAVNVGQCIVTTVLNNCFYAEDSKYLNGIRVESTQTVSEGNIVTINGVLGRTGAERSIAALTVNTTGQKNPVMSPLIMNNGAVGGADKGYVPGAGKPGANNVGLLIKAFGSIQNPDPGGSFFYLNDGSPNGIKVMLTSAKTTLTVPVGQYVVVKGASSLDESGQACIRPASQGDMVVLN